MEWLKGSICMGLLAGAGVCLGWYLRGRYNPVPKAINDELGSHGHSNGFIFGKDGICKMVLVVRNDLDMDKGEIAAQCAHSAVSAIAELQRYNLSLLRYWESCGHPKVVVQGPNEKTLLNLMQQAREMGLTISPIYNIDRNHSLGGLVTVVGIGPGPSDVIDAITKDLKLY